MSLLPALLSYSRFKPSLKNSIARVPGIYVIRCLATGREYVGSSVDCKGRADQHISKLRDGTHINKRLQGAWSYYGESSFEFFVIEQVDTPFLLDREQFHIDSRSPWMNLRVVARSNAGLKPSEDTKRKMAEAVSRKWSDPEFKRIQSLRIREALSHKVKSGALKRSKSFHCSKPDYRKRVSERRLAECAAARAKRAERRKLVEPELF